MKKILIVTGTILGVLASAVLIIFIFFPGLPTYFKVKHEYEYINETIPAFISTDISSGFESHALRGLRFKVPDDWEAHSSVEGLEPSSYRSKDGAVIFVKHGDYIDDEKTLKESLETLGDEYDPWSGFEYKEEDYRHMFASIGTELPQYSLSTRIVWYIRDGFTAKDCIRLRGMDRKVFLELAQSKDESVGMENMWKIKGEGFSGYVGNITGLGYNGDLWTVNVFPDGKENDYFFTTIKCSDEAMEKQIISSIELE